MTVFLSACHPKFKQEIKETIEQSETSNISQKKKKKKSDTSLIAFLTRSHSILSERNDWFVRCAWSTNCQNKTDCTHLHIDERITCSTFLLLLKFSALLSLHLLINVHVNKRQAHEFPLGTLPTKLCVQLMSRYVLLNWIIE